MAFVHGFGLYWKPFVSKHKSDSSRIHSKYKSRKISKDFVTPIRRNFSFTLNSDQHSQSTLKCSSDLVVIGGGLIGLSTAWEAAKLGAKVTVIVGSEVTSATLAAAGMLAPQGERLEEGPLLQLCVASRSLYPAFVEEVELTSGLTTDFSASGFLCPSFGDDSVSSWKPPTQGGYQQWLSKKELLAFEPLLNEQVVGGWWFPEDCHINNKKLYDSLKAACKRVGVQFIHSFVDNMVSSNNRVTKLFLSTGQVISADRIVVATGCWLRKLIPLPVYPQKGQMISLCNENGVVSLQRVIYGDGVYIVPRKSGEIVLGATVEDNCAVDFRTSAGGIYKVLEQSLKLVPFLSQLPMKATWTGYRPTTPDLLPIFGKLWYDNVSVCTGHHRNGILLAPISGKIASRIALDMKLNDIMEQADIVNAFSVERFSLGNMRDRSTMEDKSRRKMMIENEVGKEPWNQHVALHHKDSENLSITSSSYNNNNNNHNIKEEKETTQVKLWQVGDDGNLIPIYYRQTPESLLNSEGYGDFEEQIPPGSFGVASTRNNENRNGVVGSSSSSGNKSNTLGKDSSTNEWSRNTDAYLDISTGVDDDNYERELRKAILSNLQFQGTSTKETKPSSMEKSSMEDKKEKSLETKDNDEYREWFKFYENADTSQNIPC